MLPEALAAPAAAPILRRLKEELIRRYGPRLERVILFGSRARGEARPDSDWDVAVILKGYDGARGERERLVDLGYDLMLQTGEALSLLPLAPEELGKRTLFMHNLREEGISF